METRISKTVIKKIVITIVALAICVCGFQIIKPYLPHKYGTTTGNFMNRHRLVELDGEVYFFWSNDSREGLCKIDRNGKAVHISDKKGFLLNGVGDYLYFRTRGDKGEKDQIVKMKKDGSESWILIEGDIGLELTVVDHTIYFSYAPDNEKSKKIYSMNTDGSFLRKSRASTGVFFQLLFNPQMHLEEFGDIGYVSNSFQIKDKDIYFLLRPDSEEHDNYDLYRTRGEVHEGEFLAAGVTAYNAAEDGYLYYAQLNEELCSVVIAKMNMETGEHEQLAEIASDGKKVLVLNVAADKIYVGIEEKNPYLLNTDGTNLITVTDLLNQIEK